jgi:hypothetical protein
MRQREPDKKIMPGANNLPTTVEMNISQHYLIMGAKCFSDSTTIDCFSLSFFSLFFLATAAAPVPFLFVLTLLILVEL